MSTRKKPTTKRGLGNRAIKHERGTLFVYLFIYLSKREAAAAAGASSD